MSARCVLRLAVAGALLFGVTAGAQAHCTSTAEQDAFDVSALKSELSVLAVQCSDDDNYNAFVQRTRSVLLQQDKVVNEWFRKAYGKAATSHYDAFITLQANEQSLAGQHEGSDFCPRMKPVYAEAMAVPLPKLAQFAAAKNVSPVDLACTTTTGATAAAARSTPSRSSRPATHRK